MARPRGPYFEYWGPEFFDLGVETALPSHKPMGQDGDPIHHHVPLFFWRDGAASTPQIDDIRPRILKKDPKDFWGIHFVPGRENPMHHHAVGPRQREGLREPRQLADGRAASLREL